MKELLLEAKLDNLDEVMDFFAAELTAKRIAGKLQTKIALAIEEIFVNVASYAYTPKTGAVRFRLSIGEGKIIIEVADWGTPYDPLAAPEPDITMSAEERAIGGLGVLMVKRLMDHVEYRHQQGMNFLHLEKLLTSDDII